jgi:hypothetical protein
VFPLQDSVKPAECIYMFTYMYVYVFVCVSPAISSQNPLYVCMCVYMYVCMGMYMCVCFICELKSNSPNVCIYVCISVFTCKIQPKPTHHYRLAIANMPVAKNSFTSVHLLYTANCSTYSCQDIYYIYTYIIFLSIVPHMLVTRSTCLHTAFFLFTCVYASICTHAQTHALTSTYVLHAHTCTHPQNTHACPPFFFSELYTRT